MGGSPQNFMRCGVRKRYRFEGAFQSKVGQDLVHCRGAVRFSLQAVPCFMSYTILHPHEANRFYF